VTDFEHVILRLQILLATGIDDEDPAVYQAVGDLIKVAPSWLIDLLIQATALKTGLTPDEIIAWFEAGQEAGEGRAIH
jgi:hypothetical protein